MSANPLRYFASDTYTLNVMYYLKCNMCIKTITWLGKTVGNVRFNRSSPPEVFCKKGVLRNFTKFTGKHLCQSPFFNKYGLFFNFFCVNECIFPFLFPARFAKKWVVMVLPAVQLLYFYWRFVNLQLNQLIVTLTVSLV